MPLTRLTVAALALLTALLTLTATVTVIGVPAGADAFVFPSLTPSPEGSVTAAGDTFQQGNGVILVLPESQPCVAGTVPFTPEEAQAIRDEGLDPDRFASIYEDPDPPFLTAASSEVGR